MYAHIFKVQAGYQLIVSVNNDICAGTVSIRVYADKRSAKAAAKRLGAKPWNY
jgi:hypothetical protein